jgi:unspecific monooxygenase
MKTLHQSPTDPIFVQNPYPVYAEARSQGDVIWWEDYKMHAAVSQRAVHTLLRDRRLGREVPAEMAKPGPEHLAPFLKVEATSLLDAEPPRHTRLRALILRAFTSRAITAMADDIEQLCHDLIDQFPDQPFDLLKHYCEKVPVIVIARLLGVPESMAPKLLKWSHDMVAMYQASITRQTEDAAALASQEFTEFLRDYVETRRDAPSDDLITRLITAEEDGEKLTTDELIGTCILLLNAGHEATVHSLGNGVRTLLTADVDIAACMTPDAIDQTVEEILRYDPPLHIFTRYAYETVEVFGQTLNRGDQIALVLGAANHDPDVWPDPSRFDPTRAIQTNTAFGGGLHFCVGAPLARLEMKIALPILFARCPNLTLAEPTTYANTYHFHGLTQVLVTTE